MDALLHAECIALSRSYVYGMPYQPPELDELHLSAGQAAETAEDIAARNADLASLGGRGD
jgi:hypothetical protein